MQAPMRLLQDFPPCRQSKRTTCQRGGTQHATAAIQYVQVSSALSPLRAHPAACSQQGKQCGAACGDYQHCRALGLAV